MLQDRNGGHVFSLSISASVRPCHLLFVLSSVRPAFCPVKKNYIFSFPSQKYGKDFDENRGRKLLPRTD